MGLALFVAIVALKIPLDHQFCPMAPSPKQYTDNLALRFKNGQMTNSPLSAEVAAVLVDTRSAGKPKAVGWLYLDEEGGDYVVLKPYVPYDIYVGFHMDRFNNFRPDTYTEVVLQAPLKMPKGVQLRSCTLPD